MPPRPLPHREVGRKLEAVGCSEVGSAGSHVNFSRSTPTGTRTAIVPRHREVAGGTLRSIIRQAGLTVEEFEAL